MNKEYIKEIKRLRFKLLEKRSLFCKRLFVSATAVINWELGKRFPSLENIKKMKQIALENNIPFNIDLFDKESNKNIDK